MPKASPAKVKTHVNMIVRIPNALHAKIVKRAEAERRSMNSVFLFALEKSLEK